MNTANSFKGIAFLLALCSFCIAIPNRPLTSEDHEGMIFIRGKWFNKNGTSGISTEQSTSPQIFQQCLDHFSTSGCSTLWNQRYWVRDDYYQPGGPIFFQFGGEGPADNMVDSYYWHSYARNYGAKLIVLEHRFYGESWPSTNTDLETLKLLTSQQALADAAYFIDAYNAENNLQNADWVAFGGSYAGNLAAWMKKEYPSHIKTVVSSSGPLEAQFRFPGYMETVSEVVRALDQDCYDRIYDAFECMESLVNGTNCGSYTDPSQILPALNQCYSIDFSNQLERETFFNYLAMGFWAENWPSALIQERCASLTAVNGADPISLYGNFLVQLGEGGDCKNNGYKSSPQSKVDEILEFIHTKEGRQSGAAGWFWQTCYEFGYYMSSDPKNGLFGYETFSALPYSSQCALEYGSQFNSQYIESRIAETNEFYQGKNIDVNCVIFVNGEWDPWHTLGIYDQAPGVSANNTIVYVPRAEHCDDMLDPQTEQMRLAQELINGQIGAYLSDANC